MGYVPVLPTGQHKEWSGELIRPARAARSGWVKSAPLSIKRLFSRIFVAFQVL
jgi:hypothetical protein